jgi:hypothetical protein
MLQVERRKVGQEPEYQTGYRAKVNINQELLLQVERQKVGQEPEYQTGYRAKVNMNQELHSTFANRICVLDRN